MTLVQRRIGALFATGFALLALAGARTLYLGTLQGGSLRKAAQTQQLTYEPVPAQRGTISDRNGIDLAVSEPAQDVSADLEASLRARGLSPDSFESHLRMFDLGMPPHGGLAIGLERLTCQVLGLRNVREATLYPRDVNRLEP